MLILTACNGQLPKSDDGNAGTVTLQVGESLTCYAAGSCTVYMVMPDASSGEYVVKQDGPNGRWTSGTFSLLKEHLLNTHYQIIEWNLLI